MKEKREKKNNALQIENKVLKEKLKHEILYGDLMLRLFLKMKPTKTQKIEFSAILNMIEKHKQ